MPHEPLDLSGALKRLFERPKPSGDKSPIALFKPEDPAAPQEAAPTEIHPASSAPAVILSKKPRLDVQGPMKRIGELFQRFSRPSGAAGRVIGVDCGASSVKVAKIDQTGPRPRLIDLVVKELPLGISDKPEWDKAVHEILVELRRTGFFNSPVVMGFHHADAVVETLRLPKMPAGELRQAVAWEARERLSLTPENSVIQFLVTGDLALEGQPLQEILLVAAPRERLMSQWKLLTEADLRVAAIEPISLASFYSLRDLELWKSDDLVGLLEVGTKISHLSFIRRESAHFSRSFHVAGDSFTRCIADYCQIDYAQAEEIKRRYGISKMALEEDRQQPGHATEDRVRVAHALGLHMEQLIAEIEQSYRYFAFELGGTESQKMDRLIITGGGGLLRGLPEFLAGRLAVPVSAVDPTLGVEVSPSVQEQLNPELNQRLTVPIGLGLRPVGG